MLCETQLSFGILFGHSVNVCTIFISLCSNSSQAESPQQTHHKRKRQKQETEESQYWTSSGTTTETVNEKKVGIVEPRIVIKPSPEGTSKNKTQNTIGLQATCSDFKHNLAEQDFPAARPMESSSESSQSSSEDEIEIKAPAKKRQKKKRRSKKNSSSKRLRRKAEALLRLAAQTDNKDSNPTVTNFR